MKFKETNQYWVLKEVDNEYVCLSADFSFPPETCALASVDQDSLGGASQTAEEQELSSLTTLHIDSETSSLSQHGLSADTVTITGTHSHSYTTGCRGQITESLYVELLSSL